MGEIWLLGRPVFGLKLGANFGQPRFEICLRVASAAEEVAAHFVTSVDEQNADFRENICMAIAKWQRWELPMAWKISLVVLVPSLSVENHVNNSSG